MLASFFDRIANWIGDHFLKDIWDDLYLEDDDEL